MHRAWPRVHWLAKMPTVLQQVKDHPSAERSASQPSPVSPQNAQRLKPPCNRFVLFATQYTQIYCPCVPQPLTVFGILMRFVSRTSQTDLIRSQQTAKLFPSGRPRQTVTAPVETLLLGSPAQSFTFLGVAVAQREVLAVPGSVSC